MSTEVPNGWTRVKVRTVLTLDRPMLDIQPDAIYTTVGVRSFGNGIFHYPPKRGDQLGALRFFRVRPGQLLISNIKAWEGAVAVTSQAEEACIASNRFLPYAGDMERIHIPFFYYYFGLGPGLKFLQAASPGSAGRNRTLGISRFDAIEFPLPPLAEQKKVADILAATDAAIEATQAIIATGARSYGTQAHGLARVKAGLLQDLLTGKVRVSV